MKKIIYADNAATTKLAPEAFKAMVPFLEGDYGNPSQPYSFSRIPKKALKNARETIAACINALPEEVFFTSGGTESNNWAIKGVMAGYKSNGELITSKIEHHAILNTAKAVEKQGIPVLYLPVDSTCTVSEESLNSMISCNTKLVSVMFVNNEVGSIQPIKELANISHEYGALFHTDAVQAVGHVFIDVKALGIDMMSASAHKFNGPKGIGFLYVKKGTILNSYIDGGAQESGMRAGTENVASIVGMAEALKLNYDQMEQNRQHLLKLESELVGGLTNEGLDFKRNGSIKSVPGNISLSFREADGEMLLHRLDLMGICVSTGSACDSKNTQISHVLEAMNIPKDYAKGTIRISLSKNNTLEEIQRIIASITRIIKNN